MAEVVIAAAAVGTALESKRQTDYAIKQGKKQEKRTKGVLEEEAKASRQAAFGILKRRQAGKAASGRPSVLTAPDIGQAGQAGKQLLGL